MLMRSVVVVSLVIYGLGSLQAKEPAESKKTLETVLAPAIKAHRGDVAIAVKHLKNGESYEHNSGKPMPTASLIKFPVMVAAYDAWAKRCGVIPWEVLEPQRPPAAPAQRG